jgi:hypothetical protein
MKRFILFVCMLAFFAVLLWIGGYDFNRRGLDVVAYVAFAVWISSWSAVFPSDWLDK